MAAGTANQADTHLPHIDSNQLITRDREPAAYVSALYRTPSDFGQPSPVHDQKSLLPQDDHVVLTSGDTTPTSFLPASRRERSELIALGQHTESAAIPHPANSEITADVERYVGAPGATDCSSSAEVVPRPPGSAAPTSTFSRLSDEKPADLRSDDPVTPSAATDADTGVDASAQYQEPITDENIESRLQSVKDSLLALNAAPDLCEEASKYEGNFQVIASATSPKLNRRAKNRLRIAKSLLDGGLGQLLIRYWKQLDMKSHEDWFIKAGNRMTSFVNLYCATISVTRCAHLGHPEILATIVRDLLDFILTALDNAALYEYTKARFHISTVKALLGTLHHIVRRHEGGAQAVRERDGVRIVGKYAAHDKCASKTKAILVLGHIITEDDQKKLLEATDNHMTYLINVLQDCVTAGARRGYLSFKYGYSADDMLDGLNRMAALDSNKLKIVKMGALPLYINLMDDHCTAEQQKAACQGLWTLAFCKENRELFLDEPKCMEALRRLTKSSDASVCKAAQGALWVIEDEQKRVQGISAEPQRFDSKAQHIMMSYNWGVQKEVLKVRDRLQEAGYSVWIDVERMSGSTLDAMAKSIEDAAVVLIFFSDQYKTSAACRSEAEYTYKLGKEFIPIRMQHKYSPDGWLGMLLGTKYYFDLTKPDRWEDTVHALLRQLGDRGKAISTEHAMTQENEAGAAGEQRVGGSLDSKTHNASQHQERSRDQSANLGVAAGSRGSVLHLVSERSLEDGKSNVSGWSSDKVGDWLRANRLSSYADKFKEFTGSHLLELQRLLVEAPAHCYAMLEQQLDLLLPHILTFTIALRELGR